MALSAAEYLRGVRGAERATLARTITLVESDRADDRLVAREVLEKLLPEAGRAIRVGISGVPGVGKSTFIDALGSYLCDQGHSVAVLAIDPSSRISGGSILADKTRMTRLARRREAFIRPSPSGGTLGGVARKTMESMWVCEAAGFDVTLVETVGVGQSETLAAEMVDFFIVLLLPNAGDELQGIKRGILEVADLVAINKAEGPNRSAAEVAAASCATALRWLRGRAELWQPPVRLCSALHDEGIAPIWQDVLEHRKRLVEAGELDRKRAAQKVGWLWRVVENRLQHAIREDQRVRDRLDDLEPKVRAGTMLPSAAAEELLVAFGLSFPKH